MSATERQKVVIIGAGFGGLAAARRLAGSEVDVTVIDKKNHHLFQPLLYQVATAGLNPSEIAWPIRNILGRYENVRVVLGDVTAIDREARQVIAGPSAYDYDHLIVATGARHSYFGNDQWEEHAPGLKRIIDATEIRKRVLLAFERAETAEDREAVQRQLTFVIVGGGPTGVEMAGAIAELARHALARDFRRIDPTAARIILAEGGPRLLGAYPEELSAYAKRALERLGVEVRLGQMVRVEEGRGAVIGEDPVPCATMIWAAGVYVPRVAGWFGVEPDRAGRVRVGPHLALPEDERVFVVGDAAAATWQDGPEGATVPGIAPAAKQGGRHAAEVILARVRGRPEPKPFRYRHLGNLATIGRNSAVVDFGRLRFRGAVAWWLWGIAHIYFLIGVRAPVLVAIQWFWSYLTYGKGARLITGRAPADAEGQELPAA